MFAQRSRLRRFATQLLLVWLFAFGVGLAQACEMRPLLATVSGAASGVQAHGGHAAAAALAGDHDVSDAEDAGGPGGADGLADGLVDHGCCPADGAGGSANASCAKFCADESHTLPSAKQGQDPAPVLDVAPVATLALSVAVVEHSQADGPEAAVPPPDATPVAIAFLRLTL